MGERTIPFKIDLADLASRIRSHAKRRVGDVRLSLPFISISVSPSDREKKIAREIVIRLKDRRVLSAWECCDNCVDRALESLQSIRSMLVDKQVEITDLEDGPLYLLIDTMLTGIRNFMTFEELLKQDDNAPTHPRFSEFRRPEDQRQAYFDALELLRGHLSRCLGQVAAIAGMKAFEEGLIVQYQGPWQTEAYVELPSEPAARA